MSDRQLKNLTLRERFIAWLRNQNPRARYRWADNNNCACARFARESRFWYEWQNRLPYSEFERLDHVAIHCTTYGALLKRLTVDET